jgi:Protein of unknown function (DUF3106)
MMGEAASRMRLGRLISALALALMMALAAQPAPAQQRPGAAARQARRQALKEKAQAKNQKGGKQPGNNGAGAPGTHNANGSGAGSKANGGAGDKPAARPPNQELFKPNPNVVRPGGAQNTQGSSGGMRNLPGPWIQKLGEKSPEEQERFFENNREFQSFSPERQTQIRRNLQKWNSLSPAEKDRMIHGEQVLERLTPQQRRLYQNNILPKWQQMSPDRRQLINGRLHTLQAMPPAAQERALNDPRFMQGLTPDEQGVLRDLSSLRPPRP